MFIISIISLALIIGVSFLVKKAKQKNHITDYLLVLVGAIIVFTFDVFASIILGIDMNGGGAIEAGILTAARLFGIYFFVWVIVCLIKRKKYQQQ